MEEVRRDDGELCGYVAATNDGWAAATLFGAIIGVHVELDGAIEQVLNDGLECLAERWTLHRSGIEEGEVVCIIEARPGGATLALGHYALADAPRMTVTAADLASGQWVLRRHEE